MKQEEARKQIIEKLQRSNKVTFFIVTKKFLFFKHVDFAAAELNDGKVTVLRFYTLDAHLPEGVVFLGIYPVVIYNFNSVGEFGKWLETVTVEV
jgi:hypothetical protein